MILHNGTRNELYIYLKDIEKMDKYEYSKEWYKCTYDLYLDSCRECLFITLCNLEKCKATHDQEKTELKDL